MSGDFIEGLTRGLTHRRPRVERGPLVRLECELDAEPEPASSQVLTSRRK